MNSIKLLPCLAISALALAACGGGSGGGGTPSTATAPSSFKEVSVSSIFGWSTTQTAPNVTVTLSRSSGAALGEVRVVISNFIDKDPTGSGAAMDPMSTDVLASAQVINFTDASASVNFGRISFPAGMSSVLVEVYSLADSSKLSATPSVPSVPVSISSLSAGTAAITF